MSMRITEVARHLGVMPDEIRWFERKGYVEPTWTAFGNRRVRDYPEDQVRRIQVIVKYRREGYEHAAAYEKALQELENPRMV